VSRWPRSDFDLPARSASDGIHRWLPGPGSESSLSVTRTALVARPEVLRGAWRSATDGMDALGVRRACHPVWHHAALGW